MNNDRTDTDPDCSKLCKHCGGPKAIRNPTGNCDHLFWPDMLTDEAKRANGFRQVTTTKGEWVYDTNKER